MASRSIYSKTFDENVSDESTKSGTRSDCPECGGVVTTNTAETVCDDCGLIVDDEPIDRGPDWSRYDDGNTKRTGAPLTPSRHDRGLSTEIGWNTDANGRTLTGRKRGQIRRLRREQKRGRWRSTWEQNLAHGLGDIQRITSELEAGSTLCDQACRLFRQAQQADLLPGRSIEAMAAASVYAAGRCAGRCWTLDDITPHSRCENSSVENAYAVLNTELGLPTQPVHPKEFIPRFASSLSVSDAVCRQAQQLAEQAERDGLTNGVQPTGFAAACLYEAIRDSSCSQSLTQAEIADVATTSPPTLRAHWRTLQEHYS